MGHRIAALAAVLTLAASPAIAQAPAAPQVTAEADPGVRLTRLIDRAEVRLSRIELQPGAVRRVHAHDDVAYHLWVPIAGSLEITIGTDAPMTASSGQAFFMKRGTSHGFRNVGAIPAALFEVFIKETTTAAGPEPAETVRSLLAAFGPQALDEAIDSRLDRGSPDPRLGGPEPVSLVR